MCSNRRIHAAEYFDNPGLGNWAIKNFDLQTPENSSFFSGNWCPPKIWGFWGKKPAPFHEVVWGMSV